MAFWRSQKTDCGSVEDLRSFLMNTQVSLKKARLCFLNEQPDVSPNPQIEEALRDIDYVMKRLSHTPAESSVD